jgi:hypothetical protein
MRKDFLLPVAIGLAVVLIAAGAIVYMQWGAHVEVKGSILKVRTMALDENSSLAVVDFRVTNPADYAFVVRNCTIILDNGGEQMFEGTSVPETDVKRIFDAYPVLGQKFNDSLIMRNKIAPHSTQDRMIAARFETPIEKLDARKRLLVRIEDVDGPVSELVETKR